MLRGTPRRWTWRSPRHAVALLALTASPLMAQGGAQQIDQEYTAKIKEYLQDSRITTELVDHLPASSTVPTPLKFHGRIVGTPGELTYAKDIHRYFEALANSSKRAKYWTIGKTEEGRDMAVLAIADEATIANLEKYKGDLAALTDPRKTSEAEAQRLIGSTKPIYWITSGMHSPETGGPETLQELAYRLIVQETPYIQGIRDNIITFITPVIEVDGREKQVDTYYYNKTLAPGLARLPLMYWGKYVAHDNNRDGMGQFLALTKHVNDFFLAWKPQVMHDLHEAQTYLYSSTGTGPYNDAVDPITVNEWWTLAIEDVREMTKRGVPGVFTYGFYDGWTPNYMFFVAHTKNAIGRFYEVQSYGPDNYEVRPGPTTTSKEWFRPNPPLPFIKWGPRNNVNIQQSGVLISLKHFADNKKMYLENYWLKNKRAVAKGTTGEGPFAWVIPAGQRRKADAADAVNELRKQGLELHMATSAFRVGTLDVKPGDWIVRGDQPYRTLADMYLSIQNYSPTNPRPYDDTGWTFQFMRNVAIFPIADKSILTQPMNAVNAKVVAAGGIEGSGPVLVLEHTSDNNLMKFRTTFATTKMFAAEAEFQAGGRTFKPGAFIVPAGDRAKIEASLKELGLSAVAVATAPTVKQHELDLPRIGYVHAWQRTQDEGWVRAALDTYGIPYTYFGDIRLREGNLRAKYDVIIYPHVGGSAQSHVAGIIKNGDTPLPYKKTAKTPNLGALETAEDIRGGLGIDGLTELYKFVQAGGTLIVEGSTSTIFPAYNLTSGINIESPSQLFARGSIMRGVVTDKASPLAYGFDSQLPVYFNQDPVLNVGGSAGLFAGVQGGAGAALAQNVTPNAAPLRLSTWNFNKPDSVGAPAPAGAARGGQGGGGFGGGGGGGGMFGGATGIDGTRPRVILQFPANAGDMLLSGTLAGGEALANRAQLIDAPVGKGHVVMFAIRPFWRWQTQGTFFLGFNALLNWNDLDAGK
ncbi:MAG TPA: M14 family zinc carboxypeptidase [Gemmatimonas sp.]|uniref:M14 family zinc carboxypeptidase n=1 Tax=Gemmatimonas sp. TaxID=1962908 RepID=UPI002EDAA063